MSREFVRPFAAIGMSSPRGGEDRGRGDRYHQHRRQGPSPSPRAVPLAPQPGPRPLPPLVAPLGSGDEPMFPDARQNEMMARGSGAVVGPADQSGPAGPSMRRRSRPIPQPQTMPAGSPYQLNETQRPMPPQHYQQPMSSPHRYDDGWDNNGSNYDATMIRREGGGSKYSLPPASPASYADDRRAVADYRHHDLQSRQPSSPRSRRYRNDVYNNNTRRPRDQYYDDRAEQDGDYYYSNQTDKPYSMHQPQHERQNLPAPASPYSRRLSDLSRDEQDYVDEYRDDRYAERRPPAHEHQRNVYDDRRADGDGGGFGDRRRYEYELESSPRNSDTSSYRRGFASPRQQRFGHRHFDSSESEYYGDRRPLHHDIDGNDDNSYHRGPSPRRRDYAENRVQHESSIVYSPSVESDISTRSARGVPVRTRTRLPPPEVDDDVYELEYSRRDGRPPTTPTSRHWPVQYDQRRRGGSPIVDEEEDFYEIEVQYPSILRQSPRRQRFISPLDFGRRVTFSPSTEFPDEESFASQRSTGSRSIGSASIAHGVVTSSLPSRNLSETQRIQEESEARQQVLAEIRQAMEMRESARDRRDIDFWERQIRTLNEALRKLGSGASRFAGSYEGDGAGDGRDGKSLIWATSSWQSKESSRASLASGRQGLVKVRAPADLPEGYEFTAKMNGSTIRATIPRGGVLKGELFAVQPHADEFEVAEITPIATKTIKVKSPANLEEGHQFTLRRGDETIIATVPRGGVRAGETFSVCVSQ